MNERKGNPSDQYRETVGIGLTKLQIAILHINSAIEMLFNNLHPISVHVVIQSGFQILRDLSKEKESEILNVFTKGMSPGDIKKYYTKVNSYSSFAKHADKDPDAIFDGFDASLNELTLVQCLLIADELGVGQTIEMNAFRNWFKEFYPEAFKDKANVEIDYSLIDRKSMLHLGLILLKKMREQG